MQGPHDVGGRRGYGPIDHRPGEPVFHHRWEGHGFALGALAESLAGTNTDAFRHAIERLSVTDYLQSTYYGRWTAACATLLVEAGVVERDELDRRTGAAGSAPFPRPASNPAGHTTPGPPTSRSITRDLRRRRRFAVGDAVVVGLDDPPGHTRVAGYLRGRRGVVVATRPACPWPDAHAHGGGEDPQWVYGVSFSGEELWGASAEPGTSVVVDLSEPHLDPGGEPR